jgi:hypothetical protein
VTHPPTLDGRNAKAVAAELDAIRPGFTPEWHPRTGGPGGALVGVLARYAELVIKQLDQVPGKAFLAFLGTLGVNLLPPRAARAPLVFQVAADSPVDPPLPQDSEVAVSSPPPLPTTTAPSSQTAPEPIVFSTTEAIALTRANLAAVQSRVAAADQWADHTASLSTGFRFFDGLEGIPHHLYLAHDTLFKLSGNAEVTLEISPGQVSTPGGGGQPQTPSATTGPPLAWEYLSQDGWISFDPVEDLADGLAAAGEVKLYKRCGPDVASGDVAGTTSYWIRARVTGPLSLTGGDEGHLPVLQAIRGRVSAIYTGLPLDAASTDGLRLDTSKDFLPFGAQPSLATTFLLACDEAFSRPDTKIGIYLQFTTPGEAKHNPLLTWEYSTGANWQPVADLADTTDNFTAAPPNDQPAVFFIRPPDWQQASIGGDTHFWLRARIASGDYGGPTVYTIQGTTVQPTCQPVPPIVKTISVSYDYQTGPFVPDHCLALNGFAFQDVTESNRWGRQPFQPFQPLDERLPAIHLGFDRPLPVGLVSIYTATPATGQAEAPPLLPSLTWEYLSTEGWSQLEVVDETAGFQTSGMLQFIGPPDAATEAGAAGPLYWVRAQFTEGVTPDTLAVDALYLNAVWATQHRSVFGEVLGRSDGSAHLNLQLQHPPVLAGQRIEVQEWHGTGREWQSLFPDVAPADKRLERDSRGRVTAVWITWAERPQLLSSTPHDRHYVLERTQGLVQFGDGTAGMIPPPGTIVAANYDYGGGPAGNAAAGSITSLHSPVPFVQAVTNPVAAAGGADAEAISRTAARGAQLLRSRGRALSAADYETLAMEASSEVALTRCVPVTGPDGTPEPGWVTLVVVPWSSEPQPQPSQQLLLQVRDYLAARVPAAIAAQVRVVAPSYVLVSVITDVVLTDPSLAGQVEAGLRKALDAFLNPLTGGPAGTGWAFGEPVHLSQVARVIHATPGVDFAASVELVAGGLVAGDTVAVAPDSLPGPGPHVITPRIGG